MLLADHNEFGLYLGSFGGIYREKKKKSNRWKHSLGQDKVNELTLTYNINNIMSLCSNFSLVCQLPLTPYKFI